MTRSVGRRTRPAVVARAVGALGALVTVGCSSAPVVPTGDASGDDLRRAVTALAAEQGLADEDIPASPTFQGGGTALVTACFVSVDVLRGAQERPAELVAAQLAIARELAVGDGVAAQIRDQLAAITTAIELGDTPAFGRAGGELLDACSIAVGGS